MAKNETLSDDEKAAVKQRAAEVKKQAGRKGSAKADAERADCEEAIKALTGSDREIAEMIHAVVLDVAPHLAPKTWYGFPSYARDGKVVCFWQPAAKFKSRYGTLGFQDPAELDDGSMWPAAYAITAVTKDNEALVRKLVKKAAGAP